MGSALSKDISITRFGADQYAHDELGANSFGAHRLELLHLDLLQHRNMSEPMLPTQKLPQLKSRPFLNSVFEVCKKKLALPKLVESCRSGTFHVTKKYHEAPKEVPRQHNLLD